MGDHTFSALCSGLIVFSLGWVGCGGEFCDQEVCDQTCQSVGYLEGLCTSGACSCPILCGDGVISPGEDCEGGSVQLCTTSCGSQGTMACESCEWGECLPEAETCNGVDDDCDGACDVGCHQPVYQLISTDGQYRLYLRTEHDVSAHVGDVWREDYEEGFIPFYLLRDEAPGTRQLFSCYVDEPGGDHFISDDPECDGHTLKTDLGWAALGEGDACADLPLYYLIANHVHILVTREDQRDHLEGIGFFYDSSFTYRAWSYE